MIPFCYTACMSFSEHYGIIGYPIQHTASPKMQMSAFNELGLVATYEPFEVKPKDLDTALSALESRGILGLNVTIPHKESVLSLLSDVDRLAQSIGAVNTVLFKDGKRYGYNTDSPGFLLSVERQLQLDWTGKHVVVLGAGGASRAICHGLSAMPLASLSVVNRSLSRATSLIASLNSQLSTRSIRLEALSFLALPHYFEQSDVIINTTSVGMVPLCDQSPLSSDYQFNSSQVVIDIIYNPKETLLLKTARLQGATVLNGSGMLAGQGVLAFELFTNRSIPFDFMLNTLVV